MQKWRRKGNEEWKGLAITLTQTTNLIGKGRIGIKPTDIYWVIDQRLTDPSILRRMKHNKPKADKKMCENTAIRAASKIIHSGRHGSKENAEGKGRG